MATSFDYLNALAVLEKPDGVIAFPTDTVYGLGCLPHNLQAIEKIYAMKGRPAQKPLILMGHDPACFQPFIGEMTLHQVTTFHRLAKAHWPGSLTLIVPKSTRVNDAMTQGTRTVGLRVPDCLSLSALFQLLSGNVLATTSANLSGKPECIEAGQVFEQFGSRVDYLLINDDRQASGQASTVALIQPDGTISVLRQGTVVLD